MGNEIIIISRTVSDNTILENESPDDKGKRNRSRNSADILKS